MMPWIDCSRVHPDCGPPCADRALRAAELTYSDLALYLAHGAGTQLNDQREPKVVEEVFADTALIARASRGIAVSNSWTISGCLF
jgi:3-oxoacyl-(acyl-carrier-protein) synthase